MANRFWVAQPASGAIVSVASPPQIRLTVASTTGMTTGDTRVVSGVVGTTEANGTWVITVIDGTNIDLQGTTFSNLYVSGGLVNGRWDGANANNWVTTSGGSNYGQTVPGSSDVVTFDGSSGGGVITVNSTINVTSITCGAFTGTLDFSANNNSVTAGSFSGTGAGTRTINLGNGVWTITGTSIVWNMSTTTGLTFNANSSEIKITGTTLNSRSFNGGALTYNKLTIGPNTLGGSLTVNNANTFATLQNSGQARIVLNAAVTQTITTALTLVGTSSAPLELDSASIGAVATISAASGVTVNWCSIGTITATGGATFAAINSFNLGGNTGWTITSPSGGGGIIG